MSDDDQTVNGAKFSAPRHANGHFAKGGPGRLVGSKNKVSSDFVKQIVALGPQAITALIDALAERPVPSWAVQMVAKYIAPARLHELFGSTPEDIRSSFENAGMSVEEMNTAASGLEKLKRIEDTAAIEDMRNRLTELETLTQQRK